MITALLMALAPIAALIALGAALRQSRFLSEAFWPPAERLGYFVLLPALFVHGLATARLDGIPVAAMATVLIGSTLGVSAVLVSMRNRIRVDDAAFTSVFQGGVRFNNYVGVTAVAGLFGPHGIALAAVANAALVPTVNVLCVLVFARHGPRHPQVRALVRTTARQLVTNPLVVACVLGIGLQMSGLGLPPVVEPVLKALGQASLPLGLLCVGAALDWRGLSRWAMPVGVSSVVKFGLMPLATWCACTALGLHGREAIACVVFQSLPTASSSYIMARQLGGDAPLMAGIVASQTLLAALTLPLAVWMWAPVG